MEEGVDILRSSNLYKEAESRLKELVQLESQLLSKLKHYPDGKIRINKSGKRIQFYLRENNSDINGKYISKRDTKKISTYLQKAYYEKSIVQISEEISNIKSFLKQSSKYQEQIKDLYSKKIPEIKKYLDPIDMSDEDFIIFWRGIEYTSKPILDNRITYTSDNGEIVRSKSELNIANALKKAGIPYRYECPLELEKGDVIYPDFTVLDVKSRTVKYWEHRGMMDDRDYCKHSVQRIKKYMKKGIFLGDKLIITEETSFAMLGTDEIDAVIRHFFTC